MNDIIYTPQNVKLALMYYISNNNNKIPLNINKLQKYLEAIIYEKRYILFKENGVYLSDSLFIPFEIMDKKLLMSLEEMLNKKGQITKNDTVVGHIFYKSNPLIGVQVLVCAFLLCVLELKKYNEHDTTMCIFDVILQSLVLKSRVNYNMLLDECRKYGYYELGL